MPDGRCTPGALNPAVTQATINQTICVPGYTKTIRPPESITEPEKLESMAAYGYSDRPPSDFEYDHLVSLELGGAVNDPRNLWPESGASPNPKDSVENALHRMVCDGQMPLAQAQHIIATDWLELGSQPRRGVPLSASTTSSPPRARPTSSSGPTWHRRRQLQRLQHSRRRAAVVLRRTGAPPLTMWLASTATTTARPASPCPEPRFWRDMRARNERVGLSRSMLLRCRDR